jgi:hypothetical protein
MRSVSPSLPSTCGAPGWWPRGPLQHLNGWLRTPVTLPHVCRSGALAHAAIDRAPIEPIYPLLPVPTQLASPQLTTAPQPVYPSLPASHLNNDGDVVASSSLRWSSLSHTHTRDSIHLDGNVELGAEHPTKLPLLPLLLPARWARPWRHLLPSLLSVGRAVR